MAPVNWLRLGDTNTTFFHKYATKRNNNNLICGLLNTNGSLASEKDTTKAIARPYFQELFTSSNNQIYDSFVKWSAQVNFE